MNDQITHEEAVTRCGYVALIGVPNAGKSTLLNQMVGAKVSIVSPKVQTTRAIITGICIEDQSQLIFIDTPGIFKADDKRRLERSIVKTAWNGLEGADIIALLIDAQKGICANTEVIIDGLKSIGKPVIVILNKVDVVAKNKLLLIAEEIQQKVSPDTIFMISALKNDGVDDVKSYLASRVRPGMWMYDEEQISTAPLRFLSAEITREKLFLKLDKELPYSLSVDVESWQEDEESVTIHQIIYVLKDSQKGIILGKKGSMIKQVGQWAREELSEIVEKKVNLFLHVKVKPDWIDNQSIYTDLGIDYAS
ncbi:MAG: GTPase Era [Rickettsiales bacterium]|nr:GTPase Era [Rickettsiales bacterium]